MSAGGAGQVPAGVRLPDLRFFPTSQVVLHEEHDPERVDRLVRRLQEEAVLRNPPLVAEVGDGRVVVLDGANRVTALERLGAPCVVAQVVPYQNPSVVLDRWHHLLSALPEGFLEELGERVPLQAARVPEASRGMAAGELLAYVRVQDAVHAIPKPTGLVQQAELLRRLVAAYRGRVAYHRVDSEDVAELAGRYGDAQALVAFARFEKSDILELARNSARLPAGITRHVVPGRALRINLPLEVAFRPGTVEEKNGWLAAWVRERLREGRVRYYPEPTVLFDE
ncbi:MAG: hypothetical protein RMM30_02315 [Armatimonadota bacterium]|nr:hypothetical protein [Armatimonadota bacterium]MDW8155406.1 hypothetical protein [Armatimonadota bacterium]